MVFFKEKVGDILASKIGMPSSAIPYRREASLGGTVSYRNLSGTADCSYIVLARVTKVYFKQGKLDFKVTNTADNIVASMGGDGTCSAPIPVDFFGYQADGTPFGHYRRVAVGDLVSVAFLNGHRSTPIILGVYPDTSDSYEIISPSLYEDGDTSDSTIAETSLADKAIQPSGQIEYRSGSGSIYKALNGHSFLAVGNENEAELNQLWYRYSNVGHFYVDGKIQNPLHEEAGDWLLVHENNTDSDVDDNHITRFFVNSSGAFEVALFDSTMSGSFSVLRGSKDEGFTITRYYDVDPKKSGDLNNQVEEPDLDNAPTYVKFTLGNDSQGAVIEATTKGLSTKQSSKLEVNPDGVYLNDELLISGKTQSSITDNKISDAINKASNAINEGLDKKLNDKLNDYQLKLDRDLGGIRDIAKSAQDAGESASKVGEKAQQDADDLKNNMRYYMSISPEDNGQLDKSGNYSSTWTNIFKDVYIEDTKSLKITASNIETGTLEANNIIVKNLKLTEALGNHISANIIDTGTLRADVIEANTISTNKLNAPELSQISTMLGDIKGGSLAIGKVDENGENVEPYNKIEYSGKTWSQSNITTSLDASITSLMALTDFNQYKGKQVAISCQVTINGYRGVIGTGNPSVQLVFKSVDNSTNVDADITKITVSNGAYISTISYSLDIPSSGLTDIRIKSNIKADSIVLSSVVLTAYNEDYFHNSDAFYVDSAGNLTAHNITAKNGNINGVTVTASKIIGGTMEANHINTATLDGATINTSKLNSSTINTATLNGGTINGITINGSNINSTSKSYSSIGPFDRDSLTNFDIFQTKSSNFRVLKNGTIALSKRLPRLNGANKVALTFDNQINVTWTNVYASDLRYLYTIEARSSVGGNSNYRYLLPFAKLGVPVSGSDTQNVSLTSGLDLNAYAKYCVINTPVSGNFGTEADLAVSNVTLCVWSDSDISVDTISAPKNISRTDLDNYYANFSGVGFNDHYFGVDYPNSYFYANGSSASDIPLTDLSKMLYVSDTTHAINSAFMSLYDEIHIPGSKLKGKTGNLWVGFLVTPPVGNGLSSTQQPAINILSDFEYFNGWLGDMPVINSANDMNHETSLSILPDGTLSFNMEQPTGRNVDMRTIDITTNGNLVLTSRSYKTGAGLSTNSTTITGDSIIFSESVNPSQQQRLSFWGDPNTGNGIWFDSYGNLHAQQSSDVWRIYDKNGDDIFHVNFNTGKYWSKNGSE